MRIAIEASTWVNPRGYGRFTRELTAALLRVRRDHQFTLVADSGAAAALRGLPNADVAIVGTSRSVIESATHDGSRSLADMGRMSLRLSRGFDAVLFPTNYSFVPVRPGLLVAVVIHDAIPETLPGLVLGNRRARLLWRLKNQLACRQASLIATVSEASAREITSHLPIKGKSPLVLTEGAATIFSPTPAPEDERLRRALLPQGGRYILFVGGISPHKRVAELVHAYGTIIAGGRDADLSLVLAGPDGTDRFAADQSGVTDAIAALGAASHRVVRTGFVSDEALAALYRGATCVVMPSVAEGFGLPALEAMASGAPVVASRTPALEEVCGAAAAFLDDIAALPATLARVVGDPSLRSTLSESGIARARLFSWDEAARRLLDALERSAH